MQASTGNILNLLLGLAPVQNEPISDATGTVDPEQPSFDMLFGALLGGKGEQSVPPGLSETGGTPAGGKFNAFALASDRGPEMFGNDSNVKDEGLPIEAVPGRTGGTDTLKMHDGPLGGWTARPVTGPLNESGIPGSAAPVMISETPVPLEPGTYTITDWTINRGDETVTLQLAGQDAAADPIRVTLPLHQFSMETGSGRPMASQRVDLGVRGREGSLLARLFEQVQLKELKIDAPAPESANGKTQATQSLQMTLTGQPAAGKGETEIVASAMIARPLIRAVSAREAEGEIPRNTAIDGKGKAETSGSGRSQTSVLFAKGAAAEPIRVQPVKFEGIEFVRTGGSRETTMAKEPATDDLSVLPDFSRVQREVTAERSLQPQPVRFTLPDDVRGMLRPNGRSVQLRIDPQHLGPARLHLTMHSDRLRAVVVVDNVQAKQTVEASLDRLVESLAKADIRVDQIEVNVDQHQGRDPQSGRQPQFGGTGGRWRGVETERETVVAAAAPVSSYRDDSGYVGAGGVNLLA